MIGTRGCLGLVMLAIVGGGVATATTSDAATGPLCFGDTFAAVCVTVDPSALPTVDPTGGPGFHDCVFAGPPPCTPVDLPGPSVGPGSGAPLVSVQCTGAASPCPNPTSIPTPSPSPAPSPTITPPAATSDGVVIVGTGTISPGLTQAGGWQTFTFSGSGAGNVRGWSGSYNCGVDGNDTIGTTIRGSGDFSGSCDTPCGNVGVTGTFNRGAASVVSLSAVLTSGCLAGPTISGTCSMIPTSGPTVTSYTMVCRLAPV
jgi:hypothetical protein